MKTNRILIVLSLVFALACTQHNSTSKAKKVHADSLVFKIEEYIDANVETEGMILHVCGVDKGKMKLLTENGNIIKIVPHDSTVCFTKKLYEKMVRVKGIVKESRINKADIDKIAQEKTLLCHIDNTPCKDSAWVQRKVDAGISDSLSNADVKKLRNTMQASHKDYVSIVSIVATEYEVIEP